MMAVFSAISLLILGSFVVTVNCSPVFSETSFVNPFLNRKSDNEGKEKTTLQEEILDIFGVDHRPRPNLFYRESGKEMSARKYMIDLYNSVTMNGIVSENEEKTIDLTNSTTNDSNAASADTVVSFVNHGKQISLHIVFSTHSWPSLEYAQTLKRINVIFRVLFL